MLSPGEAALLKATAKTKVGFGGSNDSIEMYITPQCADLHWNSKINFGDEPMALALSSFWNNAMPVRVVTRLDRGVSWSIREEKKEYIEMPLEVFRDNFLHASKPVPMMEGSDIQLRKFDFELHPTGVTQPINGISAKEYKMSGLLITEDTANKRAISLSLRGVLWVAPRSSLSPKALGAIEAHRENARKWFPDAYASYLRAGDRSGLVVAGFLSGAFQWPSFEKRSQEIVRQMNALPGFVIQSAAYWKETGKEKPEEEAKSAPKPSGAKTVGGLFGKLATGDYFGAATEAARSSHKESTVNAPSELAKDALIAIEIDTKALDWTQAPKGYCQVDSDYVLQLPAAHIEMAREQKGPGKMKRKWSVDQTVRSDRARSEFEPREDEKRTEIVRLDKKAVLHWGAPSSPVEQTPLETYRQARRQELIARAREAAAGKAITIDKFEIKIESTEDTKGIRGKKLRKQAVHLDVHQHGGTRLAHFEGALYAGDADPFTKEPERYVKSYRKALGSPAGLDPATDPFSLYEALVSAGVGDIASIDRAYVALMKKVNETSIPAFVEGEWTLSAGEKIGVKSELKRLDITYVADHYRPVKKATGGVA